MKYTFAVACLLNSAVAIRFFDKQELTDAEQNSMVKEVYMNSSERPKKLAGFSQALDSAENGASMNDEDIKAGFGLNEKKPYLQDNEIDINPREKAKLMSMAAAANQIHHTKPEEVYHEPVH
jgi:hypothetical protein